MRSDFSNSYLTIQPLHKVYIISWQIHKLPSRRALNPDEVKPWGLISSHWLISSTCCCNICNHIKGHFFVHRTGSLNYTTKNTPVSCLCLDTVTYWCLQLFFDLMKSGLFFNRRCSVIIRWSIIFISLFHKWHDVFRSMYPIPFVIFKKLVRLHAMPDVKNPMSLNISQVLCFLSSDSNNGLTYTRKDLPEVRSFKLCSIKPASTRWKETLRRPASSSWLKPVLTRMYQMPR